jgi:hypothetical protein
MMNLMLHSLQPSHGAVNFILAQLYTGVNTIFSVSIFQDQAGADEAIRTAADWVKQHPAALVEGPLEITAGEVQTYKTK